MPLRLITGNGNCKSEIVSVWVVANASEETILFFWSFAAVGFTTVLRAE